MNNKGAYQKQCNGCGETITLVKDPITEKWRAYDDYHEGKIHHCDSSSTRSVPELPNARSQGISPQSHVDSQSSSPTTEQQQNKLLQDISGNISQIASQFEKILYILENLETGFPTQSEKRGIVANSSSPDRTEP